jgi:AraC family transcriptional regulator, transcriptional activator of pobA
MRRTLSGSMIEKTEYQISTGKQIRNLVLLNTAFRFEAFVLNVTVAGSCELKINSHHCILRLNDVLLIAPAAAVEVIALEQDYNSVVVIFKPGHADGPESYYYEKKIRYLMASTDNPSIKAPQSLAGTLRYFVYRLQELSSHRQAPFYLQMNRNYFTSLLYEVASCCQTADDDDVSLVNRKQHLMAAFISKVSQNCRRERRLSFYARKLGITPKYLSEVSKELSGKTAGTIIDESVILEARLLLADPLLRLGKIAALLHFSDQSFFSKFFKRYTGLTPSHYRSLSKQ